MADIFRQPLIFRTWDRRVSAFVAVHSQEWTASINPCLFPPPTLNPGYNEWAVPPGPRGLSPQDFTDPTNLALLTAPAPLVLPVPQGDWPNPRARPPLNLSFANSFKLPLQQVLPPHQTEWPVPKGRPPTPQDWRDSFKLPLQQTLPANQYNWPNPLLRTVQRPDWKDSFKLPLQQTLPARWTDWPNPRGPRQSLQDWILSQPYVLNVVTEVTDPAFNHLGNPFQILRSINFLTWLQPKTQEATLNVPIDWPNPRGRAPLNLSFADSFKLPLQQTLPENQYNWPNPILRTVQRQDWSDSFKLPLQGVVQPNQYNWPNPILRTVQRQGWADSFKLPLQQTLPANQYNWPNPVLQTVQRPDWRDWFKLPLQQTLPPHQTDWPNPRGPVRASQDWILSQPYILNVVAEIIDPAINYLGNPFQISRSVNFLTWTQPKTKEAVVTNPFVPIDWPNPIRRTVQRQDWILPQPYVFYAPNPGFNEWAVPDAVPRARQDWIFPQPYTLNVVVAGNPFFQIDWSNPRGPALRQTSFTDSFKLPLQQTLPPHQTDWPNPLGPRRGPQDWLQATSLALSSAVLPPFAQTDWPNPRAARPANRDWQDWFKLPLQQTLPPRQLDWPNPVRAWPPKVADWIQSTSIASTFVQGPLTQKDWPNPTRRKVSLLPTWTDSFKLPLQQTLPPRQLDWPVPKGPRQPVITARDFIQITQPTPPIPPVYDADNTLKNEILRLRFLDNKTGRVRFLKNEIRR